MITGHLDTLSRNPRQASLETFELIIIGGGIYGVMLQMEATRRGIRNLLIEGDDFGGGTSFNWLRILHGGLRYLQTLDLYRFVESVSERSWFLRTFPELAHPLPCLMPLYGDGLKRPSIMRLAGFVNDTLSCARNRGLEAAKRLPGCRILSRAKVLDLVPGIRPQGLRGAIVWHDAVLPESPLLVKELLRWSHRQGATSLNYMAARALVAVDGHVQGVRAADQTSGMDFEFKAPCVINAAGPWCREVASAFDRDHPELFGYSKAWNVLFDIALPSAQALAVTPPGPQARTYFLLPWKGRVIAGTGHAPADSPSGRGQPTPEEMAHFVSDLQSAIPGLPLGSESILRVFSGLLPSARPGTTDLAVREVLLDHGRKGGPQGLYSVSGVKFTTARRVAAKTLNRIFPRHAKVKPICAESFAKALQDALAESVFPVDSNPMVRDDPHGLSALERITREESVVHLEDLVFRRTNLWENPPLAREAATRLCAALELDAERAAREMTLLDRALAAPGAPGALKGNHSTRQPAA